MNVELIRIRSNRGESIQVDGEIKEERSKKENSRYNGIIKEKEKVAADLDKYEENRKEYLTRSPENILEYSKDIKFIFYICRNINFKFFQYG